MNEFRFKRFTVRNELSPMKVGTDGVLLGAAVGIKESDRRILDIGTGTGVIAMMLAQRYADTAGLNASVTAATDTAKGRSEADGPGRIRITGIDIDAPAAQEAAANFGTCPWAANLEAINTSLADFRTEESFDLIVSNPPYFDNSLKNPSERVSEARHCISLSYRDIIRFAKDRLTADRRLAFILPADERLRVERELRSFSLFPFKVTGIRTTTRKKPSRIIVESSRTRAESVQEKDLSIMENGDFTAEYRKLTEDFYLYP